LLLNRLLQIVFGGNRPEYGFDSHMDVMRLGQSGECGERSEEKNCFVKAGEIGYYLPVVY
jgi:hypothetical protein